MQLFTCTLGVEWHAGSLIIIALNIPKFYLNFLCQLQYLFFTKLNTSANIQNLMIYLQTFQGSKLSPSLVYMTH